MLINQLNDFVAFWIDICQSLVYWHHSIAKTIVIDHYKYNV